MGDIIYVTCVCGGMEAFDANDGHFYCRQCGEQVENMVQTGFDEESQAIYTGNALRRRPSSIPIKAEPLSQCEPLSRNDGHEYGLNRVKDEDCQNATEPTQPRDHGESMCPDKEGDNLRKTYVEGLQIMIELQTKALVEKCSVSPLICGIAGTIWLRYWASSGVEDDHWAEDVRKDSESQKEGDINYKPRSKQKSKESNIHDQRLVLLWYRSLSKIIPLSHTLVITYLACHLAREAILPTDILKWSLEGKLPFFTAFLDLPASQCKLSCSFMFKPSETISLYKLESQAASIARRIGLELPPVNFYAIASRYLKRLSLDSGKILPSVSQIYEWCMPPDLWLSANEVRLPTRVCVLSMVIVAIRLLYNIHGFGYWEKSFSIDLSTGKSLEGPTNTADDSTADSSKKSRDVEKLEVEAMEILRHLEEQYDELEETNSYSKNLPTYLQYCKDVVFGGMESSHEDLKEKKLTEQLWNYYESKKDSLPSNNHDCNNISPSKRYRDDTNMNLAKKSKKTRDISSRIDDSSQQSRSVDDCQTSDIVSDKEKAMKRLKLIMEDNRFCYIPPRVKVKRLDYLQYVRKSDDGAYTYAAHADYYILLQSCAKVAKIDARVMHCGVMMLERRLGWLEKRIDYCLSRLGPEEKFCEHCRQEMECDVRDK